MMETNEERIERLAMDMESCARKIREKGCSMLAVCIFFEQDDHPYEQAHGMAKDVVFGLESIRMEVMLKYLRGELE